MERHGWVTDDQGYTSRWTALGIVRRLRAAVEKHEGMPASHYTWRVWEGPDGWHWSLGLKDRTTQAEHGA